MNFSMLKNLFGLNFIFFELKFHSVEDGISKNKSSLMLLFGKGLQAVTVALLVIL